MSDPAQHELHPSYVVHVWPGTSYEGTCNGAEDPGLFWKLTRLTRVSTSPPRYELHLPTGVVVRMQGEDWEPRAFRAKFIEAVGGYPKNMSGSKVVELFEELLTRRLDTELPDEAGKRGLLLEDIRLALTSCPQGDNAAEVDNGYLYHSERGAWINVRLLLDRLARACPVKFSPGDFYEALHALGLRQLDKVRAGPWRGRVWLVPEALLPTLKQVPPPQVVAVLPAVPSSPLPPAPSTPTPTSGLPGGQLEWDPDAGNPPGAFDDLLNP